MGFVGAVRIDFPANHCSALFSQKIERRSGAYGLLVLQSGLAAHACPFLAVLVGQGAAGTAVTIGAPSSQEEQHDSGTRPCAACTMLAAAAKVPIR